MAGFEDGEGRRWGIEINVTVLKRIRRLADVDLLRVFEPGSDAIEQIQDAITLCNVLYAACQPEADRRQVTDEDFGRLLYGDVIEKATEALFEALVDFVPSRRRRVLRQITEKAATLDSLMMERLEEAAADPALDEMILAAAGVPLTSGDSSPDAPESAESTPEG